MPENPYAPSSEAAPVAPDFSLPPHLTRLLDDNPSGIWQDGKHLVVCRHGAEFPPVCMKRCSSYDGPPQKNKFSYNKNSVALGFAFGLLGAALAQLFSKKATLHLPISHEWKRRRLTDNLLGTLTFVICLVLIIGGLITYSNFEAQLGNPTLQTIALLAAFSPILIMIGSAIYMLRESNRKITAHKIDEYFVWLKDVSPEYRGQFPNWPL